MNEGPSQQTWHDLGRLEKIRIALQLAPIAFVMIVGEGLRMLACKVLGPVLGIEYKPPQYRVLEAMQDE